MNNKNFTEVLEDIKSISKKLNDSETSMEESIELFKQGSELIKIAKKQLDSLEGEVKKVLDDNNLEDFK
ncbi:exodeoxyribonuclease VII small subunit [Spiroplasma helicoides]|uniref:Exodeoxyribonuclease 7 small subunit n=1 Tax=Spiroplasma helicoides TaxID=216938 RepID=A0A1B3SKP8_9MOLU|nr:exodeoxyribonuclease VII small subunit [Spiroplasma helicoides]AOG60518.1 exodeoxyribonuclease VII small subunit [Spiroplasma helicoides]